MQISEETALRMVEAVATTKAHLVAIQGSLGKLEDLPREFAEHRGEFTEFKHQLQGNGHDGLCKQHGDSITVLQVEANRSMGRREILAMVIAFMMSAVVSIAVAVYNSSRPATSVPVRIQAQEVEGGRPPASESAAPARTAH